MWVVGTVLILIGIGMWLYRRSQRGKLRAVTSVETTTVRELTELAKAVQADLEKLGQSGGGFQQIAEVKGVIQADSPLTSEIDRQACVHYESTVSREYEETYWETEAGSSRRVQRVRRQSETISSNRQSTPFWVQDATGRIRVDPEGADIDTVKIVDRFEQAPTGGTVISFGGFSFDLGQLGLGSGKPHLGYRFRESITPLGRAVYVLGEAWDGGSDLIIRKPADKGKRFLVSLKTEEELTRSATSTAQWLLAGSLASVLVGLALIALDLVR